MFVWCKFVIEWNEDATCKENGISGDQPLRLIGHDNAGAVPRGETCVLQCFGQRMSAFLEIAIGEAFLLAFAVRLDQTHFVCELIQRVLESFADRLVFGEVQHYRRD